MAGSYMKQRAGIGGESTIVFHDMSRDVLRCMRDDVVVCAGGDWLMVSAGRLLTLLDLVEQGQSLCQWLQFLMLGCVRNCSFVDVLVVC